MRRASRVVIFVSTLAAALVLARPLVVPLASMFSDGSALSSEDMLIDGNGRGPDSIEEPSPVERIPAGERKIADWVVIGAREEVVEVGRGSVLAFSKRSASLRGGIRPYRSIGLTSGDP